MTLESWAAFSPPFFPPTKLLAGTNKDDSKPQLDVTVFHFLETSLPAAFFLETTACWC